MFTYEKKLFLHETDATGVLYFSNLLIFAQEAYELFCQDRGFTLEKMIQETDFLMPIVHAESDYLAPLRAGDELTIELTVGEIGTRSFTLLAQVKKGAEIVGSAKIIHVSIDKRSGESIPLPQAVLDHLVLL